MSEQARDDHAGVVTSLQGALAKVHFQRGSMCAHCGACLAVGEKEMEILADNSTAGAKPGDLVTVELSAGKVLRASVLAYVIPLIGLVAGVLLGSLLSEIAGVILGVGLCALSYALLRILDKKFQKRQTFRPRITGILEAADTKETED